jgi:hypothetical protein
MQKQHGLGRCKKSYGRRSCCIRGGCRGHKSCRGPDCRCGQKRRKCSYTLLSTSDRSIVVDFVLQSRPIARAIENTMTGWSDAIANAPWWYAARTPRVFPSFCSPPGNSSIIANAATSMTLTTPFVVHSNYRPRCIRLLLFCLLVVLSSFLGDPTTVAFALILFPHTLVGRF